MYPAAMDQTDLDVDPSPGRAKNLGRLDAPTLSTRDAYYLHHRSLFADLQEASACATGRLLDVGCGNKPYECFFRNRVVSYRALM
jgi:hypothetical protein